MVAPELVILCYGNICRSPLAAALLARELEARGLGDRFRVTSAGFLGDGHRAHAHSVAVMRSRGLDLEGHRSSVLTPTRAAAAGLVLAMEEALAERARGLGATRAYNLAPYATLGADTSDVADPLGEDLPAFEACARRLEALVPGAVDRILQEPL